MVGLFTSSFQQCLSRLLIPRDESLPLIEGLSGDFACVIDAHQSRDLPLIGRLSHGFGDIGGGVGAGALASTEESPQCLVGGLDQAIQQGKHSRQGRWM